MNLENLRIGLIGPLPPPSGGMANQTLQLAKLLRSEGATVELIQVNRPYYPSWVKHIRGLRAFFRLVAYVLELWRLRHKVDLFHVMANSGWSWHLFAAPAIWIAKLSGTPVVLNYRGGEAELFFEKAFTWVKPSLNRTSAIIVPSGFLDAVFKKRGFSTQIVPNIIDLNRFSMEINKQKPLGLGNPTILITRNLELIYDNATALYAFQIVKKALPDAKLVIVGSGPERNALEELSDNLGLANSVTFTGRLDNENMAQLYQSATLVINASLIDNMPISILEALASGVPIVSTNVGGIPYLVEHEKTGILVPPQDPKALASGIIMVLTDPVMYQRLREAGAKSVQQYSWVNVRSRLISVYAQVLNLGYRATNN